ncbi:methionyl-tRNA formyltransferase [Candidatus Berkelbacteria bacterium]|nr:methionyl-tRNA formyltransferase [Candidatus Berkelbacteria bacterium]
MKIRLIYDPILRKSVHEVTVFNSELNNIADEMIKTMRANDGVGIAANQVGLDMRMFVCGYNQTSKDDEIPEIPFQAFVNPKIVKFSKEKDVLTEGCLSLPILELPVERSSGIEVEYQDLLGNKKSLRAKGVFARIIQHEIDHLNGILFTDRAKNISLLENYRYAKIVFFGSDEFSLPSLKEMFDGGLTILGVITESPKRAGRGDNLKPTVVQQFCNQNGISVFNPENKKEITNIIKQLKPDLIVLASYGKILENATLEIPIYGCLNVHPSLLPKYRGATPIQNAILNGDKETGVTIMKMNSEVDAGLIIDQQKVGLSVDANTESLKNQLAQIGAKLLIKNIPPYLSGQSKITNQAGEPLLTKKLSKEMGQIDWDQPIEQIDRNIRALNPWPGTFTFLDDKRLIIKSAKVVGDKLELLQVQLEGKNVINFDDFKRGYLNQLTKQAWFSKIA